MPLATLKVSRLLDADDVPLSEVEKTIMSDPAFTAALLRAASSAIYGDTDQPVTTVRAALMRLGVRTVKAVALSIWTQALVTKTPGKSSFAAQKFRDHSMFVGYLAKYLYSARQQKDRFRSQWSPDEVFAMGILHDLGTALLAVVAPQDFEMVHNRAVLKQKPFSEKFQIVMGHPVSALGVDATITWGLDPMFSDVIAHLDNPQKHATEPLAIACVHYADRIANAHKFGLFNLPSEPMCEYAEREVGLPAEDIPRVVELIVASMQEPDQNKRRCA